MENLFLAGRRDRADDLLRWAEQLDALSSALHYLADEQIIEKIDPHVFFGLAWIISEYADAFSETVKEAHEVLDKFYTNGGNRLAAKLTREINRLKTSAINGHLHEFDSEKIDQFLEEIATSLAESKTLAKLQDELLLIKDRALSKMKSQGKKEMPSPGKPGDSEN